MATPRPTLTPPTRTSAIVTVWTSVEPGAASSRIAVAAAWWGAMAAWLGPPPGGDGDGAGFEGTAEPKKPALPKSNIPPSAACSQ